MSLSLQHIYEETRQKYHLKLICGGSGLDQIMTWVHISEDIATCRFLQSGELVLTTGFACSQSEGWLYDFISRLIRQNTCGLIINVGKYLQEEDITGEIRRLCDRNHFPVFTMPWEVLIFDITHDYYDRIFSDTQTEHAITAALLELIHNGPDAARSLSLLAGYGYPEYADYCICCLEYTDPSEGEKSSRLSFFLRRILRDLHSGLYLCHTGRQFLILSIGLPQDFLKRELARLPGELSTAFPELHFYGGLGSRVPALDGLAKSYAHAKAAAAMAAARKRLFYTFDELGFFRLLLSMDDRSLLESYTEEQLGPILRYDEGHGSNYLDTLYWYLLCGGSVRQIAAALYCHRNTVNYRIRVLREEFRLPLEDMQKRFALMAAFQIREYLQYF